MKNLKTAEKTSGLLFVKSSLFTATFWLCMASVLLSSSACEVDKEVDLCASVTCLNGGECVNGLCDCPPGFTGPDCSDELTPSCITVKEIIVKKFPATKPDGSTWDKTEGEKEPDLLVVLRYWPKDGGEGSVIHYKTKTLDNVKDNTKEYSFSGSGLTTKLCLDVPTGRHRISVYDDDASQDDELMDGINFFPYAKPNGFPNTITVKNGKIHVELKVEYSW